MYAEHSMLGRTRFQHVTSRILCYWEPYVRLTFVHLCYPVSRMLSIPCLVEQDINMSQVGYFVIEDHMLDWHLSTYITLFHACCAFHDFNMSQVGYFIEDHMLDWHLSTYITLFHACCAFHDFNMSQVGYFVIEDHMLAGTCPHMLPCFTYAMHSMLRRTDFSMSLEGNFSCQWHTLWFRTMCKTDTHETIVT